MTSHLAIPAGSYTVIRGLSGSGKTTLLNLIAGITIPTSGHIQVHGSDITIFIALLGGLAGLVGGHGMAVLGAHLLSQWGGLALTPFTISALQSLLLVGVTLLGGCAGLLPAVLAYRTEVAENLAPLS